MTFRRITSRVTITTLALALVPIGLGAQRAAARTDARTTDANITMLTTNLLERSQLSHRPFDAAMASAVLDRYLDSLDVTRSLFRQSDIRDLSRSGTTLSEATRGAGDTTTARTIFARYLERLGERTSYVVATLKSATFDFTGHDVYSFDREHAERPRDQTEAEAIWLQELRSEYLQAKLDDRKPKQIVQTLTHRYEQQLRTMKTFTDDDVMDIYLNALAHVYDPHSDYLGREQMDSFAIAMNLSLYGIGATLENTDGYCTVRELVPGGPADRSGLLKPGDRIVAVAQPGKDPVDITNMPLSRAVELIRGPRGSTVALSILPAGAPEGSLPRHERIVRDQVKLEDQEAKARIVELPSASGETLRLGVIDLPSFYADVTDRGAHRSATADVSRLLAKLEAEGVHGVILDLRRNGGGSLEEAISLTGLFIRKGPVVETRDSSGEVRVGTDPDPSVQYDGPLVLLTSRMSASASEILAGALQDYGRALIVGDAATFGKGTVQQVLPLARIMDKVHLGYAHDPGALKLTTSKFYRPSGASTQLRGVASDIVLPSLTDLRDVNESTLKNAMPWDAIPATPHDYEDRVAPYVPTLRSMSARRVAGDRQFSDLASDLARLEKLDASKTLSLNEADRRKDLADARARDEERERADQPGPAPSPAVYEITLENASAGSLPAPGRLTELHPPRSENPREHERPSAAHSTRADVILGEGLNILADYVHLLHA